MFFFVSELIDERVTLCVVDMRLVLVFRLICQLEKGPDHMLRAERQ